MRAQCVVWLGFVLLASCGDPNPQSTPDQDPPTASTDPIDVKEGRLRDAQGREVLLRGINARVEGIFDVTFDDGRTALQPIPPFGPGDCQTLAERFGMNLLRLPINWSGIEPEPGVYNDAYIDGVLALVDACEEVGVYTLIDLHQDAWSKHIGEDGAPLWAIVPAPTELLEGPLEDLARRRTSRQVLAAFETFFKGEAGLQDAYADMLIHLTGRLEGHRGVVGVELMNEPVVPGGQVQLDAFHTKMSEAVRSANPEVTLFFEPDSLRNFLDKVDVEAPYPFDDAVYSPHIYTGVFTGSWQLGDEERLRRSVLAARAEAEAFGTALFIGEFGNDPNTEIGMAWIEAEVALFDEVKASWAFWVYEEWSQDVWGLYDQNEGPSRGGLRPAVSELVARPFPQAVDGDLRALSYDGDARTLRVEIDAAGPGEHLLSAPTLVYPQGVSVTCDGADAPVNEDAGPGRIGVRCEGEALVMGPR